MSNRRIDLSLFPIVLLTLAGLAGALEMAGTYAVPLPTLAAMPPLPTAYIEFVAEPTAKPEPSHTMTPTAAPTTTPEPSPTPTPTTAPTAEPTAEPTATAGPTTTRRPPSIIPATRFRIALFAYNPADCIEAPQNCDSDPTRYATGPVNLPHDYGRVAACPNGNYNDNGVNWMGAWLWTADTGWLECKDTGGAVGFDCRTFWPECVMRIDVVWPILSRGGVLSNRPPFNARRYSDYRISRSGPS